MNKEHTIASIIYNALTPDQSPEESAAVLGQLIGEIRREKELYGHSKRWAELKQLIAVQEQIVLMRLENTPKEPLPLKRRHLRIVKYTQAG